LTNLPNLVEKLVDQSKERGRAAVTPKSERDVNGEIPYTVLKITLNNERNTVYEPEFLGGDANLIDPVYRRAGSSVFYIKLNPVEEVRGLDIMLRLKALSGYKPPDLMRLPIECAYSSGLEGASL
jgi:hypothetical protein